MKSIQADKDRALATRSERKTKREIFGEREREIRW
jgi:hypothetical protein